jgi:MerR-like DNA binding protein
MSSVQGSQAKRQRRRIRLDPERRGYFLEGKLVKDFKDRPKLSNEERTLLARWAERFAPEQLSDAQRVLLATGSDRPTVSDEQRELLENQQELRSPYLQALFDALTNEERQWVRKPASHSKLRGKDYPLSVGDMSALTGASDRQIRKWTDDGLLPAFRQGPDRRFYSAALIRAFALARAPHYSKSVAAAAARGEVGHLLQLIAATIGHAANTMPPKFSAQFTALAEELSRSSKLMRDVSEQKQLRAMWGRLELGAPQVAAPMRLTRPRRTPPKSQRPLKPKSGAAAK